MSFDMSPPCQEYTQRQLFTADRGSLLAQESFASTEGRISSVAAPENAHSTSSSSSSSLSAVAPVLASSHGPFLLPLAASAAASALTSPSSNPLIGPTWNKRMRLHTQSLPYTFQCYLQQNSFSEPWSATTSLPLLDANFKQPAFAQYRSAPSDNESLGHDVLSDPGYGTGEPSVSTSSLHGGGNVADQSLEMTSLIERLDPISFTETALSVSPPVAPKVVKPTRARKLECLVCNVSVKTQSELRKHDQRHNKRHVCTYDGCNRKNNPFSTINDLERHLKAVHKAAIPGPRFQCNLPACPNPKKIWPRADNFRSHLRRIHFVMNYNKGDIKRFIVPDDSASILQASATASNREPLPTSSPDTAPQQRAPTTVPSERSVSPDLPRPLFTREPIGQVFSPAGNAWPNLDITSAADNSGDPAADLDLDWLGDLGYESVKPQDTERYRSLQALVDSACGANMAALAGCVSVDGNGSSGILARCDSALQSQVLDQQQQQQQQQQNRPVGFPLMSHSLGPLGIGNSRHGSPSDGTPVPSVANFFGTGTMFNYPSSSLSAPSIFDQLGLGTVPTAENEDLNDRFSDTFSTRAKIHTASQLGDEDDDEDENEDEDDDEKSDESSHTNAETEHLDGDDRGDYDDQSGRLGCIADRADGKLPPSARHDEPMHGSWPAQHVLDEPARIGSFPRSSSNWKEQPDRMRLFAFLRSLPKTVMEDFLRQMAFEGSPTFYDFGHGHLDDSQHLRCQDCRKVFVRPCDLKKHYMRHEKPYFCTFPPCSKTFGSKNDWKRHETGQHLDVRWWTCVEPVLSRSASRPDKNTNTKNTCGQSFAQRAAFRTHLQTAHHISDAGRIKQMLDACMCRMQKLDEWFWCGFCRDRIPAKQGRNTFSDRFDHIDDHFFERRGMENLGIDDWEPCPRPQQPPQEKSDTVQESIETTVPVAGGVSVPSAGSGKRAPSVEQSQPAKRRRTGYG